MTFINEISHIEPLVYLTGGSTFNPAATAANRFRARLVGGSSFLIGASNAVGASALITGAGALSAIGRVNDDANRFGSVLMTGESSFTADGRVVRGAVLILRGGSTFTANGSTVAAEQSILSLFITVAPDYVRVLAKTYSARVIADGVSIGIKSFTFTESAATAGIDASFTLWKQGDRATIEAANNFTFEIFDGAQWREMFAAGRRTQNSFNFGFADARPNDGAAFSTAAPAAEKLNRSPLRPETIFDPARVELNASEFETIFGDDGATYTQTLTPVAGLRLSDLLRMVLVERCGFAGFTTNLPDWKIRRADFSMTGTYFDGIAGHIGFYNPLIFVKNDRVFILDSTGAMPSGFPAPVVIAADRYKSANLSQTNEQIDGYLMSYSTDETDYDYFLDVTESDPPETTTDNPFSPLYSITNRTRTVRYFYKNARPFAPVRSETVKERAIKQARINDALETINDATELYNYDSYNNIKKISKTVFALAPNLASPGVPIFTKVCEDTTKFSYRPDLKNPRRLVLWRTLVEHSGLIAVDAENPQLGRPFKQDLSEEAHRAGNLTDEMTTEFGAIRTTVETLRQSRNGQIKTHTETTDFLVFPPSTNNATTDARSGDISLNGLTAEQKQMTVLRPGAVRANTILKPLSVAELPLLYALPLARRRLANRTKRVGTIELVGIDLTLQRGGLIELLDRDGVSVGNYIIDGFSITGANLGQMTQTTRQVLEVREVAPVVNMPQARAGSVTMTGESITHFYFSISGGGEPT